MESIIANGIDIVSVERVERLFERYGRRFMDRVYCADEKRRAEERPDVGQFLAGRFAAKEAVLKVLGCGLFSGIRLPDIAILSKPSGAPYCELSGTALATAESLGIHRLLVTISHCDSHAVAQALGIGGR